MALELVKISQLPAASAPLSGAEQLPSLSAGTTQKLLSRAFVLPIDPILTATDMSAVLPTSRRLVAGTNISIVDGGAGGPMTISASVTSGGAINFNAVVAGTLAAAQNNYAAPTWAGGLNKSALRLTAFAGGSTVTGIDASAVVDGQTVLCTNMSTTDVINLPHQSGLSTAANRFRNPAGGDLVILPGQSFFISYETTTNSWRVMS